MPLNESGNDFRKCRRMLVGPGVNQPEPYPGYAGFVGWQSPIVLRDGTMLVGFSSGYWHASPPTDFFKQNVAQLEQWKKIGMPTDVVRRAAGGRRSFARPTVDGFVETEGVNRHALGDRVPNFCQTKDGTILCSFFTYPGPTAKDLTRDPAKTNLTGIVRSFDNGETWEQKPKRLPVPFVGDATDGPIIELADGSR